MKTVRWVATDLRKHSSFSPPPGKIKLKKKEKQKTQNQKRNENCNMLSRKMSNHRTKERSTEPSTISLCPELATPSWQSACSPGCRLASCWWSSVACAGKVILMQGGGWPAGKVRGWAAAAATPPFLLAPAPAACCCFLFPLWSGAGSKLCLFPSANPQGPGSMGTVRLVQNMCKMIFFTSKVERHPFDKGPFGEGYHRKLRVPFVPKAKAGSWHRA